MFFTRSKFLGNKFFMKTETKYNFYTMIYVKSFYSIIFKRNMAVIPNLKSGYFFSIESVEMT